MKRGPWSETVFGRSNDVIQPLRAQREWTSLRVPVETTVTIGLPSR